MVGIDVVRFTQLSKDPFFRIPQAYGKNSNIEALVVGYGEKVGFSDFNRAGRVAGRAGNKAKE